MCEQIALKPAPAHSRDFSRELAGAFLTLSKIIVGNKKEKRED